MKLQLLIVAILTSLAWPVSARTISWFNAQGDLLVSSGGLSTLDATFSFEIGTFGTFTPTDLNLDQWAAHWKVFDRAVNGDGWNGTIDYYTRSVDFLSSGLSSRGISSVTFVAGETAYLWVYNSLDLVPTSEWALVRDATNDASIAWDIPTADAGNPNSLDWDLLEANSAVFGLVNGAVGGGSFTPMGDPGGGVAWLQTAPVPEPGSALMVLIASVVWVRYRRREAVL